MKKVIRKALVIMVACALLMIAGYSFIYASKANHPVSGQVPLSSNDSIKIAHRSFGEHRILGQLLAVYLESKGYKTEVSEYEGIKQIFNELQNGDIDIYAEYTGTLYTNILNQSKTLNKFDTYNYVKNNLEKEYNITLLTVHRTL